MILDIFYLKIFEDNSSIVSQYGSTVRQLLIIVLILFLLWLIWMIYEKYVSKWNHFCFNMITSKHQKFVLSVQIDEFMEQCDAILLLEDEIKVNEQQQDKIEVAPMEPTFIKDQLLEIQYNNKNQMGTNFAVNEYNCGVKECECIHRIINALKYHSSIKDKENSNIQLLEYCMEYKVLLDDYIHIVTKHNNTDDLDEIYNILTTDYQFSDCNINRCGFSVRHYRNRNIEEEKKQSDEEENSVFYGELMDRIHCYIFHLYDFGMRVRRSDFETEIKEEISTNYIDNTFKNIKNVIQTKLKLLREIDGIQLLDSEINKFNINNNDRRTFMDGLCVSIDKNIAPNKQKK
eukprot:419600_1